MEPLFLILWNLHTIFESLPISSSGHLALLIDYAATKRTKAPLPLSSTMNHLMHIPTALVVLATLLTYASYFKEVSLLRWIINVLIADLVTGSAYLIMRKTGTPHIPLSVGFFITACALLSLMVAPQAVSMEISWAQASIIGLAQAAALLPGISRLALTFTIGVWLGIEPLTSILFSLTCELGLIVVAVAKALRDIYVDDDEEHKSTHFFSLSFAQSGWLIISLLISYGCLQLVILMSSHQIIYLFGWYMLALALLIFLKKQ